MNYYTHAGKKKIIYLLLLDDYLLFHIYEKELSSKL